MLITVLAVLGAFSVAGMAVVGVLLWRAHRQVEQSRLDALRDLLPTTRKEPL